MDDEAGGCDLPPKKAILPRFGEHSEQHPCYEHGLSFASHSELPFAVHPAELPICLSSAPEVSAWRKPKFVSMCF
jgi:hypothetical protein